MAIIAASPAQAQEAHRQFDIPPQPLASALVEFSRQSDLVITASSKVTKGKSAPAVKGSYVPVEALNLLLANSGLHAQAARNGGYVVELGNGLAGANGAVSSHGPASSLGDATDSAAPPHDIVVTGTRIRGAAPVSGRLRTYDRAEIEQSTATTLDQFARQIPTNFSNQDAISNAFSFASLSLLQAGGGDSTGGAAFNLDGLGVTSTLTLLNGHRLAASGSDSFVDISMIPLAAVGHIDVLQDGSSAIYGSDAVAGVVNIITRSYDGAESSIRYGAATEGGGGEVTASQLLGKTWGSGNLLVSYEYDHQNGVDAAQRSYLPPQGGPFSLVPKSSRNSVFASGRQELTPATTVSFDAIYSNRDTTINSTSVTPPSLFLERVVSNSRLIGGSAKIDHNFSSAWHAAISTDYSAAHQFTNIGFDFIQSGQDFPSTDTLTNNSSIGSVQIVTDGTLAALPGGNLGFSGGASYNIERFRATFASEGLPPLSTTVPHRGVGSIFGEMLLPVIGRRNNIPLVDRLTISLALRYDHYSDFGSTTNPKVAVLWSPTGYLDLHGTFGTSFRAPTLYDLGFPVSYIAFDFPKTGSPTGVADTLQITGGRADLKPQTARMFSASADWYPLSSRDLKLTASYARIRYKRIIGTPPLTNSSQVLNSSLLASFVNFNPDPRFIASAFSDPGFQGDFTDCGGTPCGPGAVTAIFDDRDANLGALNYSDLQLSATYQRHTSFGEIGIKAQGNWVLHDSLQAVPAGPFQSVVNTFGGPPRWKGLFNATWSKGAFAGALTLRHVSAYTDDLVFPASRVKSLTTLDLNLELRASGAGSGWLLKGARLALNVQNLTDAHPPHVDFPAATNMSGFNYLPFDPANASPLGRVVSLQLTKAF